ncbi:MAG: transposase [Patescibacteria group bacterium]|nr:transposase [Patescibacteria group bacterium]
MPRESREFINDEIYHVIIRRIGEEKLFLDVDDYYRGIFSIYEFNSTELVTIRNRRAARIRFKNTISEANNDENFVATKDKILATRNKEGLLVEILAFCFMPNHIHLLIKQLKDKGISKFMLKVESGYAAYFKNKYGVKIRGHFFQDKFKAVHIKTNDQLKTVFVYIHANPVSLIEPKWKEIGIKNYDNVIQFLGEKYRWSSYFDYIGKKNFPSVVQMNFLVKTIGEPSECRRIVEDWMKYREDETQKFKKL